MIKKREVFYVIYRILSNTMSNDSEIQNLLQSGKGVEYCIYQDVQNAFIEGDIRFEQEWYFFRGILGDRSCLITCNNMQDELMYLYSATFTTDGKVDLVAIGSCKNVRYDGNNSKQWKRSQIKTTLDDNEQREIMTDYYAKRVCNFTVTQRDQNCLIIQSVRENVDYQSSGLIHSPFPAFQRNGATSLFPKVDNNLQTLTILPTMYNHKENNCFILTGCLQKLSELIIISHSMVNVSTFCLTGVPCLQTVLIDDKCGNSGAYSNPSATASSSNSSFKSGYFSICNCPMLERVRIGNQSFGNVNEVDFHQLDSLKTVEIGSGSFYLCENVKMRGKKL